MMIPEPDSAEELGRFARLQDRLPELFQRIFPDPREPRTVLVVPSLSLDSELLDKVTGVQYYEERMLCMLMLLRLPRTHVIYVTSVPVHPTIVDYYLHLLNDVPGGHARRRLTLLSCHDASSAPLTRKILDRPRLIARIRRAITRLDAAHMTCFNVSELERTLAVQLGMPIYGCDPALGDLGSKSGSREVFREAGILLPDGFERLRDPGDVVEALTELKRRDPGLERAAIKLEEGMSGEGNAVFSFAGCPDGAALAGWVEAELPVRTVFEAQSETWESYGAKYQAMGGIVEVFVDGEAKRSPSVQCRIDPTGEAAVISTHDQVLGGPSGQIFKGCTFPADSDYRLSIQEAGMKVARILQERSALGRFGVDFVSVRRGGDWRHHAIEINLRKGGTTHPFMTLQFLTDGTFDQDTGVYYTPTGQPRYYYASDNLKSSHYRGLLPEDLIDIAVERKLHFHGTAQQGVVFHLIGALSEFGKLGVVCVADSIDNARDLYASTVRVLDEEARRGRGAAS